MEPLMVPPKVQTKGSCTVRIHGLIIDGDPVCMLLFIHFTGHLTYLR